MTNTNLKINKDSILAFEYFTSSGDRNPCIISEAESLILSLIEELKGLDVFLLIHKSYKYLVNDINYITPIFIEEPLEIWLEENSNLFKRAIFIAAENDMNLYKLTNILEENNVKVYGSSTNATMISSDKFKTYDELYGVVAQPRTFKLKIDSKGYWLRALRNLYEKWQSEDPLSQLKIIIKPISGVDCEDIKIINNLDEISYDLEEIFPINSRILIQDFIEGIDVSVSLISDGKKAIPLSLNKQEIELDNDNQKYLGGCLPFESNFKQEAYEIAIKSVESISGIKGFVGVDLILNNGNLDLNDVYLLEVNSRFTTPYVALQKIANFNIAQSIIDLLDDKIKINDLENQISLNGKAIFKKEGNFLKLEVIK
ncbi:ATP-grasp domain-containing protein [Methanobrevibacter sp. OttesenSCG-928-K11]|nr:ATP-grasp domain-containing protein [Methanobrevibacter sp. OttesenSCG-928-K11]